MHTGTTTTTHPSAGMSRDERKRGHFSVLAFKGGWAVRVLEKRGPMITYLGKAWLPFSVWQVSGSSARLG